MLGVVVPGVVAMCAMCVGVVLLGVLACASSKRVVLGVAWSASVVLLDGAVVLAVLDESSTASSCSS